MPAFTIGRYHSFRRLSGASYLVRATTGRNLRANTPYVHSYTCTSGSAKCCAHAVALHRETKQSYTNSILIGRESHRHMHRCMHRKPCLQFMNIFRQISQLARSAGCAEHCLCYVSVREIPLRYLIIVNTCNSKTRILYTKICCCEFSRCIKINKLYFC